LHLERATQNEETAVAVCPQCRKEFRYFTQIYPQIEKQTDTQSDTSDCGEQTPNSGDDADCGVPIEDQKEIDEVKEAIIQALQYELSEVTAKSTQNEIWLQEEKVEHAQTKREVEERVQSLQEDLDIARREIVRRSNELQRAEDDLKRLESETNNKIVKMKLKVKVAQDGRSQKAKQVGELTKAKRTLERTLNEKVAANQEMTKSITRLENEVKLWKKKFEDCNSELKSQISSSWKETEWLYPPANQRVLKTPPTSRSVTKMQGQEAIAVTRSDCKESDSLPNSSQKKRRRTLASYIDARPLSSILNES